MIEAVTDTLDAVLDDCWVRLCEGASDPHHAFHLPVTGTLSMSGNNLRTVVLRGADPATRQLCCNTDVRASKIEALCIAPRLDWLFLDRTARIQIRATGPIRLHTDDAEANAAWASLPPSSRINFAAESPPGAATDGPSSGLPFGLTDRVPSAIETEVFRQHFAHIVCTLDVIEWLALGDDGHRRARFAWPEDGEATSTWLVP